MSAERYARPVFGGVAWLFVACIVIQVFLVGVDAFEVFEADPSGSVHQDFAYTYGWLAPGMVLLAAIGRFPTRMRVLTVALLVAFAVQVFLPTVADELPMLAAVHAGNALVVFWLAVTIAHDALRGG